MTRVPLGDYFCGVLARNPSTYDFLAALDLPPPIRRARTAPLDPAHRPRPRPTARQLRLPDHRQRRHRAAPARTARGHPGLGRHRRAADRSRRLDLAEHARSAAARSAARRTHWADQPAVAERAGRLHGHAASMPPGPWLVSNSRPRTDRGAHVVVAQDGVPLDRRLEARRRHAHLPRLRADGAQLQAVDRQRGAVALPDHPRRRRQRRRLGAGAALPALGRRRAAAVDGRLLDAPQADAGLVLGADRRVRRRPRRARCSSSADAAWSAGACCRRSG